MGVGKELFVASNARSLALIVTSCLPKISTLHKKKVTPYKPEVKELVASWSSNYSGEEKRLKKREEDKKAMYNEETKQTVEGFVGICECLERPPLFLLCSKGRQMST